MFCAECLCMLVLYNWGNFDPFFIIESLRRTYRLLYCFEDVVVPLLKLLFPIREQFIITY